MSFLEVTVIARLIIKQTGLVLNCQMHPEAGARPVPGAPPDIPARSRTAGGPQRPCWRGAAGAAAGLRGFRLAEI